MAEGPIRELTYEERCLWGVCKICDAKHGEQCKSSAGEPGVHSQRLIDAPAKVREIPVE